jgi:predicted extracellular nuclease
VQHLKLNRVRLLALIVVLTLALVPLATVSAQTHVFINEIHYDNTGTDTGEAIEIAGPAGTDLSGWSIVLYNGSTGAVYDTTPLNNVIPDQQDGFGTLVFTYTVNGIQNGPPDGIALVAPGGVAQFLSYEGAFTAVGGPADGLTSIDIGVAEGSSTAVGDSLQLVGTGASYEDFSWSEPSANTFGAVNTGQTFVGGSGPDYTPIYDIQYTADPSGDSPLVGQADVTTEGIVTARFQNGYFIEDPAGGGWKGLWVHDTANTPALGDRVRLTGTVSEYYGLTELATLTGYQVVSSGNPLPAAIVLATGDASQEQWEGVLVRVEDVSVTAEEDTHGEWEVDDGTGPLAVDNLGSDTYVPVLNDQIAAIVGPLNYSYDAFKIAPRDDGDIILPVPPSALVINEILADPAGDLTGDANGDGGRDSFDDEFVEIVNDSDDDIDVSGWTLSDAVGVRHTFPAETIVSAHCAIVVFGGGTPTGAFGGVVVQTASTGELGLNNTGDIITLSDGSTDQAVVAYGSEGGDDQSLTRDPDVGGSTFVKHSEATGSGGTLFSPGTLIDGASFAGCAPAFGACGDPATFIHEVQGAGPVSPLNGTSGVVIEGVVVGDFQDTATQLGGFFIQEEDADTDGDVSTSEGIFVYDSGFGVDVSVGDVVRVQGNVTEHYAFTELNGVSHVVVCTTGASVTPAVVTLPVPDIAQWETYEGMLLTIPQTLYATDNYDQGRYGEVSLSVGAHLVAPTNVASPGADALALQDLNDRSRILMDDGSNVQNPLPLPPYIGEDNTLRAGDTTPGLTGVLAYGFDAYRIHPTQPVEFTRVNARSAAPPSVGGSLKIASFNVLNYFNGDGMGGDFPTSRGATTPEEFARQRAKIISAILAMDADAVGLIEIENDGYGSESAIADLVNGLNDMAGPGTYAFIDPGVAQIGADEIAVGFVYKPATVTPVGLSAILDSSVDPTFIDTKNRPALAQTFEENATGERFTLVVNHFKSKGSDCEDIGDPDQGDGQGNCPVTRANAALALTAWLSSDPTGSGDPDFLIIGDLNSYAMEDPIVAIEGAGYTNLIETFAGPGAYSYVYYGQAGYLDQALANGSLAPQVAGATVWHINSDEPSALDYNDYNQPALYNADPYRSSDHDPVVVGLNLFSAKPLENVDVRFMQIHWLPFSGGQARFAFWGEFDLPGGFTRNDLSRDMTLCVAIAGETSCDTVTFAQHRDVWFYRGWSGAGDGLDIDYATITWKHGRAFVSAGGKLKLPGVDWNTHPAEAEIGLSFALKTPVPTPELFAEVLVPFGTHRRLWSYISR